MPSSMASSFDRARVFPRTERCKRWMRSPGTAAVAWVVCRNGGDALVDEQAVGPDLVLTTEREGGRAVLSVRGELDAYSAPGLEEQVTRLISEQVYEVVLD